MNFIKQLFRFRCYQEELGFDDKWVMIIGVPLLSLLIPVIIHNIELRHYPSVMHLEFFQGLMYVGVFWFYNRRLLIYLRRRYTFDQTLDRVLIQLGVLIISLPVVVYLCGSTVDFVFDYFGIIHPYKERITQSKLLTFFVCFAVLASYEAIYFFVKFKQSILEKERIERDHIQMQLDNLRSQINPHFLFNSLTTLMTLIPKDSNRAMHYLDLLSRFYRHVVSNQNDKTVSVEEELRIAELYAELLNERFRDALTIKFNVSPHLHKDIIPLSIQLLIENAVKHNIVSRKTPLQITIESIDDASVRVSNPIQQRMEPVESTGTGLSNIKERYSFFSDRPVLINREDNIFSVELPLLSKQPLTKIHTVESTVNDV